MVMSCKIVVLGDGGVGKTALTIQLCLNHFIALSLTTTTTGRMRSRTTAPRSSTLPPSSATYDPTIEDSYRKHAIIDDQPYLLEILDTAGQEEYTALRDQWIRYELSHHLRLRDLLTDHEPIPLRTHREGEGFVLVYSITARATFERIERFRHQITRVKDSETIPIVLVGNKADRANEREVGRDEGQALAKKLGCEFVETSAKTRLNLELAYYTVVRMIRAQREGTTPGSKVAGGKKHRLPKSCSIL
ncbi:BZ3500_MvSof-1268-A1-R1_Chr5-2g07974 [Microbotryum saponariae]|uniref:BZ3500_MvSof-1268-A1-R1_Chr5-2g07974 protein n=1 Tax=Microbotryum saponariae TaxID=289078 RepID=A0A2X0KMQ6_9BASI|nr:BZ3500_MvSof-1268-A1-R1_Chr5-2g07974 [Microbotryum saponariae]SDA05843.1 BZ3501_MvSof-1269-A2-R1_Chr5-2g07796 [Microbotryum saponariae]